MESSVCLDYKSLYRETFEGGSLRPNAFLQRNPFDLSVTSCKETFSCSVNGESTSGLFELVSAPVSNVQSCFQKTSFVLSDSSHNLKVEVVTEVLKDLRPGDQGAFARSLKFTNEGMKPLALSNVQILKGLCFQNGLSLSKGPYQIGRMVGGAPGKEGDFHWEGLPQGRLLLANQTYTERYRHPFAVAHDPSNGDFFVLNLAFSGGFRIEFEHSGEEVYGQSTLSFSVGFGGRDPARVLLSGESATTPRVIATFVQGTFDEAIQANIDFVRAIGESWTKTQLVECSAMTNRQAEVEYNIEAGLELDADIIYIDAGWYIPKGKSLDDWPAYCGDWYRPVDTYDTSLVEFGNRCRAQGKRFGLWMDFEKIGFFSETFRKGTVKYLVGYDDKPVPDGAQAFMADLTDDDTYKWAYDAICHVIDTYQLDYFRLDSGVYATEACRMHGGIRENAAWRYYDRLYELFQNLRTKYPEVVFQNCAGGGMRADAGMTTIMSNTWISDINHAPESFRIINGISMMIPVEYCVKLINGMGAETGCTDYFKLNVARYGSPLIPGDERMLPDGFKKHIRPMLKMFKTYVKDILPQARIFHHTPDVCLGEDGELGALEIASRSGDVSMASAFTLGPVENPGFRLTFKGVLTGRTYHVYANDQWIGDMTGDALRKGVPVEIEEMCDSICLLAIQTDR